MARTKQHRIEFLEDQVRQLEEELERSRAYTTIQTEKADSLSDKLTNMQDYNYLVDIDWALEKLLAFIHNGKHEISCTKDEGCQCLEYAALELKGLVEGLI